MAHGNARHAGSNSRTNRDRSRSPSLISLSGQLSPVGINLRKFIQHHFGSEITEIILTVFADWIRDHPECHAQVMGVTSLIYTLTEESNLDTAPKRARKALREQRSLLVAAGLLHLVEEETLREQRLGMMADMCYAREGTPGKVVLDLAIHLEASRSAAKDAARETIQASAGLGRTTPLSDQINLMTTLLAVAQP